MTTMTTNTLVGPLIDLLNVPLALLGVRVRRFGDGLCDHSLHDCCTWCCRGGADCDDQWPDDERT